MTPEDESLAALAQRLCNAQNAMQALSVLSACYAAHDSRAGRAIECFDVRLACRAGCDVCCFMRVGAKAHEILLIAETVKVNWSAVARRTLMANLGVNAEKVSQMTWDEQCAVNLECPLLVDHHCSVYSIRPLGCRRHHAQDYAGCKFSFDNPTDMTYSGSRNEKLLREVVSVEGVIASMFASCGYDLTDYELNMGLLEALSPGTSLSRWQDKKEAFINTKRE